PPPPPPPPTPPRLLHVYHVLRDRSVSRVIVDVYKRQNKKTKPRDASRGFLFLLWQSQRH
ncbi:hypothetical protein QLF87_22385, partial [Salmonella enterica subsp. enterica serovar Oslo]|nr:hypothetical protein [Salmonella enterica subsp. enterica serovar Oslo]